MPVARTAPRFGPSIALALGALLPVALAHDDPKATDLRPAYRGTGYRAAWRARTGVPVAQTKSGLGFQAVDVSLLSWLPLGELSPAATSGNDCWGYVSPSGREYALVGTSAGTAIVEVTDADDAALVAHVDGPVSLWRDIKTYGEFAYAVSEGGGGIQVLDLRQVDAGQVALLGEVHSGGSTTASHNVAVDAESGFLYRCGGDFHGLRIYDLSNPAQPQYVGAWNDRYVHDAQVVTYPDGREIAFAFSGFNSGWGQPGVDVLDVTDKQGIVHLGSLLYPEAAYAHQGRLTGDLRYLLVGDELDEVGYSKSTTTHVFDVQDLASPSYVGAFSNDSPAIGHEIHTRGDLVFEANYSSGLRVFDLSQGPLQANEVAWFDTAPASDAAEFISLWGTYPLLPSGIVLGSDMQGGLFVWWVGEPPLSFEYPDGVPDVVDPSGQAVLVRIDESQPGALVAGTAALHFDLGYGLQSAPLVDLGGGLFSADLPPAPCGAEYSWYVSAESTQGVLWTDPPGMEAEAHVATAAASVALVLADDLETPSGWVSGAPGDDASTGQWALADPVGTAAEPAEDHTATGALCWITGQGTAGGDPGEQDVDGGTTTLLSPVFDLSALFDPRLSYWRWYDNAKGGAPGTDTLLVDLSDDGGLSWTPVEVVGPSGQEASGGWFRHSVRVRDVAQPTAAVRLRFRASDLGASSIVEAAIDDLELWDVACPPLAADSVAISISAGGTQVFALDAGPEHAGEVYILLGSLTGTSPGFPAGGFTLPLAVDAYTSWSLGNPNSPPLSSSLAALDATGGAAATFALGPGAFPAFVGSTAWHAYALLHPTTGEITLTSNAVPVALQP